MAQQKKRLFAQTRQAVINADDAFGQSIIKSLSIPVIAYSTTESHADVYADQIQLTHQAFKRVL